MKLKPTKPTAPQPPVIVAIPSTTAEKLASIKTLAVAIERLATALCSVNTRVEVSHCHFVGASSAITVKEQL